MTSLSFEKKNTKQAVKMNYFKTNIIRKVIPSLKNKNTSNFKVGTSLTAGY